MKNLHFRHIILIAAGACAVSAFLHVVTGGTDRNQFVCLGFATAFAFSYAAFSENQIGRLQGANKSFIDHLPLNERCIRGCVEASGRTS